MKLGSRKRSSQALLNKPIEVPIVDSIDDYEDNKMLLKRDARERKMVRIQRVWARASGIAKAIYCILVFFPFVFCCFYAYDKLFLEIGDEALASSAPAETSFAVAINTFKRPDRLRGAVQHYAETCGKKAGISEVFIIWAEQGVTVPDPSSFFVKKLRSSNEKSNRAKVSIVEKDSTSLNARYEPIKELKTMALFNVDDDIRVDCDSLLNGFDAWTKNPDSMVGYYPRLAAPSLSDPESDDLVYHTWPVVWNRHKFNFVVTKAAFMHSKYLELYSGETFPQEIKDYIDEHRNGEDIAMAMLVANYTKYKNGEPAYPIYVEGKTTDLGLVSIFVYHTKCYNVTHFHSLIPFLFIFLIIVWWYQYRFWSYGNPNGLFEEFNKNIQRERMGLSPRL